MHVLIEAADIWLATPKAVQSAAVGACLLQRLNDAPREENWSVEEHAMAANRVALLKEASRPALGFLGCSACA